jgi:serine/threonine protein kinase
MTTIPKLLSEGSYGCIFRPGINCSGLPSEDEKFITKMESKKTVTENEKNISDMIQKLPHYEENFAPIIENCSVELATIDRTTISDCELVRNIEDPTTKIELNKIKYIGKNTLGKYLILELKDNSERFFEILLETHIVLLESLKKLNDAGIIHNDLKENNVVCRDGDGRPIIIDFGLSIDKKNTHLPDTTNPTSLLYKYFFKYTADYTPWCIDIVIINFMMNHLNKEWLISTITQEQINELVMNVKEDEKDIASKMFTEYVGKKWETLLEDFTKGGDSQWLDLIYINNGYKWRNTQIVGEQLTQIIDGFFNTNPIFVEEFSGSPSSLLIPEDKEILKSNLMDYLKSFETLTWEDLLNSLLENSDSWDNYALSIIYIKFLKLMKIKMDDERTSSIMKVLSDYERLLIEIIVAKPNERLKANETKKKILEVLQTMPKVVAENFKKIFKLINYTEIEESLKTAQLEEVKREKP